MVSEFLKERNTLKKVKKMQILFLKFSLGTRDRLFLWRNHKQKEYAHHANDPRSSYSRQLIASMKNTLIRPPKKKTHSKKLSINLVLSLRTYLYVFWVGKFLLLKGLTK
jgi:hypothetical protein